MSLFRSPLPAFAAILMLQACSSTKPEKGFYENRQPKYAIETDKDGRKDGKEIWWYPNGQEKYEAVNRAGLREGKYTAWYVTGNKWYEGMEIHGKPEGTLTYWYADGKIKSQALFRDGIQLERKDWDENGKPVTRSNLWSGTPAGAVEVEPEDAARAREAGLRMWALRVRQTVESYWHTPRQFEKEAPHKAVARIKVDREGRILNVAWDRKSGSAAFDALAQQTFRKIKRMPAFPPQVKEDTLDVQYEFVSEGKAAPRRHLEARDAASSEDAPAVPAPPQTGGEDNPSR